MSNTPIQALETRHTIRNFDDNYVIPKETLEKIMEAVRVSPTAYGIQDIDFLVCTDKKKNQEAADAQLKLFEEGIRKHLEGRKEQFKVKNVLTCDCSAEVILYKNERGSEQNSYIHAGIAAMAICVAAKSFGLDTMVHQVMVGPGAAGVYGLDPKSLIVAVAIGKARPDAHIGKREIQNKITYI